jgi:hypothetical protein
LKQPEYIPVKDGEIPFDKVWWFQYQKHLCDEIIKLTQQKCNDYTGGKACVNPFSNFDGSADFGVHPIVGVCIRLSDKVQRAKTFARDGKLAYSASNDTVQDIFTDIIGYSLIVLGMLKREEQNAVSFSEDMS